MSFFFIFKFLLVIFYMINEIRIENMNKNSIKL